MQAYQNMLQLLTSCTCNMITGSKIEAPKNCDGAKKKHKKCMRNMKPGDESRLSMMVTVNENGISTTRD